MEALRAGYLVRYMTLDDIVRELRQADQLGTLRNKLAHYQRPHVLIVDELGHLRLAHADTNRFFQLINRRYTRSSMIITSNKRVSEWAELFGDEVQAVAILDRLLHDAEILTINGASWRLRGRGDRLTNNAKARRTAKTGRPIPLGSPAEGRRRALTTPIRPLSPSRDTDSTSAAAGDATIRGMRRPWDRHPPWAHWSFFVIWVVAGTLGPIALLDSLLIGPRGNWWIGFSLCVIWVLDLAIDSLLVRRLQRSDPSWQPWQPPRWKSRTGPAGN